MKTIIRLLNWFLKGTGYVVVRRKPNKVVEFTSDWNHPTVH